MNKKIFFFFFIIISILAGGVYYFNKPCYLEGIDQKYSIKYKDNKIIINRINQGEIDLRDTLVYQSSDQSYRSINSLHIVLMKKDTTIYQYPTQKSPKSISEIIIKRENDSTYTSVYIMKNAETEYPLLLIRNDARKRCPLIQIKYDNHFCVQEMWIYQPQKYIIRNFWDDILSLFQF